MVHRIKPIKTEKDIERLRAHLAGRPKDLFIFDLLTQTGLLLDQALGLKMADMAGIGVGDPISVAGISRTLVNRPRMTGRLMDSYNRYVETNDLEPENYLFMSRKGHNPLSPQSVSRLVSTWFREAGLTGLAGVKSLRKTWETYFKDHPNKKIPETDEKSKTGLLGLLGGVNPLTLSDQIEARLIELILTGQIAPGSRLIIKEIADEMGISSMPVRDALTRLAGGGIVRLEKNRGYTVNVVSEAEFKEITELRRTLEPMAAVTGCRNTKPKDLQKIFNIEKDYSQALKHGESQRGLKINRDFHFSLYRLAQRPVLLEFLEKLWRMISPYYHLLSKELKSLHSRRLELGEYYKLTIFHHEKIIESLENRNGNELAKWIKADIDYSAKKVLSDFYNRK
ncbi:MAG: FCD domain-containing protein [Deltaproteobacteria bacterium]|nr:FCD domain-containing protein [Deltaproteobacteria bacterium]